MSYKPLIIFIFALTFTVTAFTADGGISKDYTDAKFQLYKNNQFFCELNAKKAHAVNIGEPGMQQIAMEGVAIEIYNNDVVLTNDEKPPLKLRITSAKGHYIQAVDEQTKEMQDIVILEGTPENPVIVERYKPVTAASQEPILDSVITCSRTAKWNNTASILNGAGVVTMRKTDKTLNVIGEDMVYELREDAKGKVDLTTAGEQNLGGVLEILKNAKMEILNKDKSGRIIPRSLVTITAQGSARYDFDRREITFNNQVNVVREQMRMKSEHLNIVLDESDAEDTKFKELTAWCDATGLVTINGKGNPNAENSHHDEIGEWFASGQFARYKEASGELILTDDRPQMLPLVRLDQHEIRNTLITYFVNDQRLTAVGDKGETRLGGGIDDYTAANNDGIKLPQQTIITFQERLFFEQKKQIAVFEKNVKLQSADLVLDAQKLRIDFLELDGVKKDNAVARVKKITCSEKVELLYQNRKARCDILEVLPNNETRQPDNRGRILLDQFILSGTQLPEIETPGNGYFQARKINVYRYERSANGQKIVYIEAVGPGSGVLGGAKSGLAREKNLNDGTTINFKSHMIYDQLDNFVDFYGQVTADSGEQVMSAYRLLVRLIARVNKNASGDNKVSDGEEISMIDAMGNDKERVTLHWGRHHCEANRVIREFSCGRANVSDRIILDGDNRVPAKVWEENGAVFQGPKIVTDPEGKTIYTKGAGELTLRDRKTNEDAMVQYSDYAYYQVSGENSYAVFNGNVILRRDGMKVTSRRLRADLVKDPTAQKTNPKVELAGSPNLSAATLPRRLSRVIVEGDVTVRQGKRTAIGHRGQVNILENGDDLLLEGDQQRLAEVDNNDGFNLLAPQMMVQEAIGLITAKGRGQVIISNKTSAAANAMSSNLFVDDGNYKLLYGGNMQYNMNGGRIDFVDEVVMLQATLQSKCDRLSIFLDKTYDGLDENNIRVRSVECEGNVYFNSFPLPIAGVNDPFNMLGRTIRTRSQMATYSASIHRVVLSGMPPPQMLLQEKTGGGAVRSFQQGERIWIDTRNGETDVSGDSDKYKSETYNRPGPLIFPRETRPWFPSN